MNGNERTFCMLEYLDDGVESYTMFSFYTTNYVLLSVQGSDLKLIIMKFSHFQFYNHCYLCCKTQWKVHVTLLND